MAEQQRESQAWSGVKVRSFEQRDREAVAWLYEHGLMRGQLASNDTGLDIENIEAAYFDDARHHFWVAETDGAVRGMIGVGSEDQHTAEIRRLRVDPDRGGDEVPRALLETALNHCRHHGYLKILLDTHFEPEAAVAMFDQVGFQHTRTRSVQGKEVLEFYLDLYRPPESEREGG